MKDHVRQAWLSGGIFIGLTIIVFVAPLLALILLLPYILGLTPAPERKRLQRSIAVLLGGLVIFFATPVVTWLPYPLARPLAQLKINTLYRLSGQIQAPVAPLQPLMESVAPADLAAYAEFLRGPGTGIIRLGGNYPGASTYYDFFQGSTRGQRDLYFDVYENQFEVAFAGRDAGLFLDLGSSDIAAIDLIDPRIQALMTLAPPVSEVYDRADILWKTQGKSIDGIYYDRTIGMKPETVYALRSIMPSDNRDIVVVLKVVRRDSDGSLIVAWKLLADFSGK